MISIFVYTLVAVLIILLLVLILPSHVIIEYDQEFKVKLRIFFVTFPVYPFLFKLEKKTNAKLPVDKKKSPENKIGYTIKKHGVAGIIKSLKKIINLFNSATKKILRHIKFKSVYLKLGVSGDDASDTAIKYGRVQALANNIFSRLISVTSIENYKINIYPDFMESDTIVEFKIDIYSQAGFVLYEIMIFALNYARMSNELKLK